MDAKLRNEFEKMTRVNRTPFILNEITERQLDVDEGRGNYALIEVDLSDSLADHEIDFFGDHITVVDCPDVCTMKLNHVANAEVDLQLIDEVEAPFKKLYLNNTAGSGTLKILVGSKGMFYAKKKINKFADDDKLYFGSSSDVAVYWDGTNLVFDPVAPTHETFQITFGAGITNIYGGQNTGDDIQIFANATNSTASLKMLGAGNIELDTQATIRFRDNGTSIFLFEYAGNISTFSGGLVTGDDLVLKANATDALPYIKLLGNSTIDMYCTSGHIDYFWNGTLGLRLRYNSTVTTIEAGSATGNDLLLQANETDSGEFINIAGVGDIDIVTGAGDIFLNPSGNVKFGTKTGTGDVAVDGYVTIKDSAGATVKLATVA